jgi:hypothetical protein
MFGKVSLFALLILVCFNLVNAQTDKKTIGSGGIINGRFANMVKPEYPKITEDLCAGGIVKVEVLIYEATGAISNVKALSGDKLLYDSVIVAVRKSKIAASMVNGDRNIYTKGIVVYNFDSFVKKKCTEGGVVNSKATYLPKPIINPYIKIKKPKSKFGY